MVGEAGRLFRRSAAGGIGRFRRQAAAAAVVAAIGLVTSPGVEAQTTLTVNGASGSNTISAAQSTTGGLVINQIFGVDYLIVGGGGGSGGAYNAAGGAGGAGGLLHNTGVGAAPLAFSRNSYTVTVGRGGAAGINDTTGGGNGANSVLSGTGISTLTAIGGGGGGASTSNQTGSSGGSGGGGGGPSGSGGAGTLGQGNAGKTGWGGGGGAGQTGADGGQGLQIGITGTATYYAGGGRSPFSSSSVLGGGGGGSGAQGTAPQAGSPNTGGGGGAFWNGISETRVGARGGSGIAVLRYGGPVLPGLSTSVTSGSGSVTTSSYTDGNGVAQQVYSFTIGSSTTSGGFAFDMSGVSQATLDQRLGTILSGGITGNGGLTFNGPGRLTLSAVNTYTGPTSVTAGGLLLSGSVAGDVSIAAGARLGGSGGLGGSLALSPGSFLVFDPLSSGLQLGSGNNVTIDSTFSVDSLLNADGTIIDWGAVADGTYTLLANTTTNFSGVTNFGPGNAKDLGAGRSAYFQNGSLQLVVVPEPGVIALAGIGIVAAWALRRRCHPAP